jgi:PQQ-like domain
VRRRVPAGWVSLAVLAAVLLAVVFFPVTGPASGQQPAACHGCRAQSASAQRWTAKLPGDWAVGAGATGTVPASGQAYVAVGGGIAVVGDGLTVTAYWLRDGAQLWQATLTAPAGWAVSSVRAWQGVVTAGVVAPGGRTRTEIVLNSATGAELRQYPAAMFGGAVAASAATTVVVGPASVTSYANATGKVRWKRRTGAGQSWRADGDILYVAESAGGYLGSAPVTSLRVINLGSGAERTLHSPPGHAFSGTLALAADGTVLFTSAAGVTAYSGSTGGMLWSVSAAVPEGADSAAQLVYLTVAGGALIGVDPLTGTLRGSVSGATAGGSAGIYVVRGKVALGLDSGQGGEAWGYSMAAARVIWTASGLPWPHYFSDLSGLGGSADESGSMVVVAVCGKLSAADDPAATPPDTAAGSSAATSSGTPGAPSSGTSASTSPSPSPSPSAAPEKLCAVPELVALNV